MLLAHQVPGAGQGKTGFADTRQAWKDLPEEQKHKLRNLVTEHNLWHSRRLASPDIYHKPTAQELNDRPPSYHNLVQLGPSGEETLFIAAHAKTLFSRDGTVVEDSQKIIWDIIKHCSQEKVSKLTEQHSSDDLTCLRS